MPRFAITEKAGRFVAGHNNTGVGTMLTLTDKQAEHEVRLGTLVQMDIPDPNPANAPAQDDGDVIDEAYLTDMTIPELQEFAAGQDIELHYDLRKAEIIEAILTALEPH